MRREKKTKRTKAGLKGIQRRGGRIESLESRQMMFGDDVFAPVDHHLPINPGIEFEPPVVIQPLDCIDFEDMPAAGVYGVGATFTADNTGLQAQFTGEPFTWSGGGITAAGQTSVDHSNHAGHLGQDMMVNNILVDIDFGATVDGVVMNFGEFGGNLNLEINGDFRNFNNFQDVNGLNIGGVNVNVVGGGFGNDVGRLAMSGPISSLKVGGQELWIDHVCTREKADHRFDWGDAPDEPYPTLNANNGAHHLIDPDVFLGNRVEGEADGQPTFASDGDDVNNIDDEDGVTFLTPLVPGNMATVEVVASTQGWLNAWIDFDRSGSWDVGTSEEIFSAEPLNPGVNILNFMVPAGIQPGANEPTYSRWRFSTTDPILQPRQGAGVAIPNGEVEDHLAFISEGDPDPDPDPIYDFGDAPDQPYPTLMANGGAHHLINPDVFLGDRVEPELDGQPTFASDGDDVANIDDEDGVNFLTPIVPGGIAQVEVIASTDGYLNAWIDFDRNGSWDMGLPEQIFNAQPLVPGSNVLTFAVPATAQPAPNEPTYSRWRFSTTNPTLTPKADPTGAVPDGEVEDHLVFISEGDSDPDPIYDFGDAPDEPYPTLMANGGAHHLINQKVYLGDRVEPEFDGQPTLASDGDDVANIDDEDGVNFLTPIVPGGIAQVEVIASVDGYLNAWIDFDRNGSWDMGLPEQIFNAQPLVPGSNVLTFAVPNTAQPAPNEPTYSRWRFSTTNPTLTPKADPTGAVPDGEVEDHLVFISKPPQEKHLDFGDAPDQPYPTLLASDGARHYINPDVFLGARIDADPNGMPSFLATGDDLSDGNDDEDGVKFLTPINRGQHVVAQVEASVDGFLDAWIDLNQNGHWEPSEQIALSTPMIPGTNYIDFVVPTTAIPTPTRPIYSRFRFSLGGGLSPNGLAKDGEVEDYATKTGDLDGDGTIGVIDIDHLASKIQLGDDQGDLNGDGVVSPLDMDHLVHNVLGTTYGDTNLDGIFDSEDIIHVFAAGHYEDSVDGNSGWAQGDWDGDGDFTSSDLIRALQDGGYNAGANATAGNGQVLAQPLLDSQPGDNQDVEESESDRSDRSQELSPVAQSPVVQSVDALFADDDRSLLGDGIADEEELMNTLAEDLTLV